MTEKEKIYELIGKELSSEISGEEKKSLEKRLSSSAVQKSVYKVIKHFWYYYFPKSGDNNIIDKTEKKLGFTYQQETRSGKTVILKVAAISLLVLSLSLTGFYYLKSVKNNTSKITEYKTGPDDIKEIVLSDGTKVWLNASPCLFREKLSWEVHVK